MNHFSPRQSANKLCAATSRLLALLAVLSAALCPQAWAQEPRTTTQAPAPALIRQALPAFSKLQMDGAMDLQLLAAGEAASLDLPAGRVRAWVDGETLHLLAPTVSSVASDLGLQARPQLRLQLAPQALQSIELRGSSQVQIGRLQAERLKLVLSGSGSLRVEQLDAIQLDLAVHGSGHLQLGQVQAQRLGLHLSASGQVQMASLRAEQLEARLRASGGVSVGSGRAVQQEWVMSGSGDVRAAGLQGQRASLRAYGSGDADLGRLEQLQISLYGSGDVSYAGQPLLQLWMPGSGSLRPRTEEALAGLP